MVELIYTEKFESEIRKVDNSIKIKAKSQIKKIIANPETGKPLQFNLKGERTVYVRPYRIIYAYENDAIYFLRFEHRKEVYEQ